MEMEYKLLQRSIELAPDPVISTALKDQFGLLGPTWLDDDGHELWLFPKWGWLGRLRMNRHKLAGFPEEAVLTVSKVIVNGSATLLNLHVVNGTLHGFSSATSDLWKEPRTSWEIVSIKLVDIAFGGSNAEEGRSEFLSQYSIPEEWKSFMTGASNPPAAISIRSEAELAIEHVSDSNMTVIADAGASVLLTNGESYFWFQVEDERMGSPMTLHEALASAGQI